jgi:glycosyltransferase involved in cell wall biosynthesis
MKIVLLHYSAPPVVGGVESVIGHHARLMVEAGHGVRIVAGRGAQMDERVEFVQIPMVDSRHPVIDLAKKELDEGRISKEFDKYVEQLGAELRDVLSDADCLIAHNVASLNKNLILTAALKRISEESKRLQVILWHHDLAWTTPRYRSELHDGYPWNLLCEAWDGVEQVTISDFRRRELAELMHISEDKIWVIPNGVDVARFLKFESLSTSFMESLSLLDAWPIVLLPVRITPRKNIELAIRVLNVLCREYPQARLIVTGPLGPHNSANLAYFEKLTALRSSLGLENSVHFLAELTESFLPDEVISDFYHLADILFMPSREEGFGIPVLEAGLAGLPAFCADIPPLRDLGGSFVNYFSLDESPEHIASTIIDELLVDRLFGGRVQVRSRFSWQKIYQDQIERLLGKGKNE